jgi:hypothetical protein
MKLKAFIVAFVRLESPMRQKEFLKILPAKVPGERGGTVC